MKRKRGNWCRRKKRHCAGKKNRKQSWHIKKKENNEKLDDAKKKYSYTREEKRQGR